MTSFRLPSVVVTMAMGWEISYLLSRLPSLLPESAVVTAGTAVYADDHQLSLACCSTLGR